MTPTNAEQEAEELIELKRRDTLAIDVYSETIQRENAVRNDVEFTDVACT